jgi:chloride channel protein, CIC family
MPAAQPTPQLGGAAYLRLILLGAAIGIPAALVAALFLALVHDLEHWLWHDLPEALDYSSPPWFLVVGLPVVGALIVVAARLFLPGDGGHSPLHGLSASPTPPAHAASVALAGLGSLAFGAVLGPELPVVTLGAAIGVAATWFVRLGERETAVLSTAGGTSAISALFGGPIVAGLLVLESGLPMGAALLPVLLPGLVAAAVGYLIFVGFGDWGGLGTPGLVVPDLPPYEGVHAYDLAVALVVGVLGAVILAAARVLATRTDGLRGRLGLPALLIAGGLAVGVLAELADLLGADSQDVLFSGQASCPTSSRRTRRR